MDALLVVDMDYRDGWTGVNSLSADRKRVACAIRHTLSDWRNANKLIAFVVYSNRNASQFKHVHNYCLGCDSPMWDRLVEFLEHRHGEQYEPVFFKYDFDAFTNPDLTSFLLHRGIDRVILSGCRRFTCVLETARGALLHGFSVALLEDCVYPQFQLWEVGARSWKSEVIAGRPEWEGLVTVI